MNMSKLKVTAIRQEGTVSTGPLLFVDVETPVRFGSVNISWQIDPATGMVLDGSIGDDAKPLNRRPTPEENLLLLGAFEEFLEHGPTGA